MCKKHLSCSSIPFRWSVHILIKQGEATFEKWSKFYHKLPTFFIFQTTNSTSSHFDRLFWTCWRWDSSPWTKVDVEGNLVGFLERIIFILQPYSILIVNNIRQLSSQSKEAYIIHFPQTVTVETIFNMLITLFCCQYYISCLTTLKYL